MLSAMRRCYKPVCLQCLATVTNARCTLRVFNVYFERGSFYFISNATFFLKKNTVQICSACTAWLT